MGRMFGVSLLTIVTATPLVAGAKPDGNRLVAAPVEASSALFRGWDDPKGDHHPLFAADDDKRTGWVEGAEGDGTGEWIRFHVTPVQQPGAITLQIRNGCQASGRAFKSHARVAKATVTALPGGPPTAIELADEQGWQTFEVPASDRLRAVELRIDGVHPGKGDEHACLADVQIYTPASVDPAAQKRREKEVEAWVKARRKVGRLLDSRKAREKLPFAPRYIARSDGQDMALDCGLDQICFLEEGLRALKGALGAESPPEVDQALAMMKDAGGWQAVELMVEDDRPVPPIDGLCSDDGIEAWPCGQGVYLPPKLGLLTREGVKTRPVKIIPTVRQLGDPKTCTTYGIDRQHFARPTPGTPAAVVALECIGGKGQKPRNSMQLWVYDQAGRLVVSASPREAAVLSWSEATKDRPARLKRARKLVIRTGMRTTIEPERPIDE